MSLGAAASAARSAPAIGFFERWLTLWVALCIAAGVALGQLLPAPFQALGRMGGLDVCVNVAGVNGFAKFGELSLELWHRVLAVNLTGPMLVTQAALPHLRESKGNVVTVASISGLQGQPYLGAYCASKGGLLQLMKSLAVELAADEIRVNCVCPGGVGAMPSADDAQAILPTGVDPSLFIRLNGVLPGVTEQRDVAEALAWLASDAARSVSGAVLLVDRVTLWS